MSTLPSGPVRTPTFPPDPSRTLMLFRSLCVTIGETAALSLMRVTRPRASANASRGVSQPPVAANVVEATQQRQKPRLDMTEECIAVIVPSIVLPRIKSRRGVPAGWNSAGNQLAAQEVANQRRHLVEL